MGSLCSKPGTVSGGHQVLGSASSSSPTGQPAGTRLDPRAAAAEAAERRMKAVGASYAATRYVLIFSLSRRLAEHTQPTPTLDDSPRNWKLRRVHLVCRSRDSRNNSWCVHGRSCITAPRSYGAVIQSGIEHRPPSTRRANCAHTRLYPLAGARDRRGYRDSWPPTLSQSCRASVTCIPFRG